MLGTGVAPHRFSLIFLPWAVDGETRFRRARLVTRADLFAVIHTTVTLQRLGVTFVKREDGRMII
jgi:hypothetical protein